MIPGTEQRKLAAIMFTDMVGYSALAQRSEALALELLEEHRQVVRELLPRHGGREVKTMGDGFLLEFPSALAAVQGAVELQTAFHERNQVSPPGRQLRIRIGIHVGDVVMRDGDIHGDGVNLAARIEPLAAPGGICISSAVQEQVRNKLSQPLAALGPAELKNIELPVVVHRVVLPWEKAGTAALPKSKRRNRPLAWALALLVVAGLGFSIFARLKRSTPLPATAPAPATAAVAAAPSPAEALVAKARALLDDDPLMTRANVELAEQLSLEAITRDPTNAEAYAVAAWVNFRFLETNYEDTAQRRADLKKYADKARLLAADSVNAELAVTGVLLATNNRPEAVARLRALADRAPNNLTILRAWAGAAQWGNGVNLGDDENSDPAALARLRAHSPLGRAYADSFLANQHWARGEYVEADRVLDGIFASGQPVRLSYLLRLIVQLWGWGDLPAARNFAATLPAKLLLEDVFINHVSTVWTYSGEYDKALATLDRTQREMLQETKTQFPTSFVRGEVLAAAGRLAAAAIQWREALAMVDKKLAANPGNPLLHGFKALLLARLGNRAGAAAEFDLATEIAHPVAGTIAWGYGFRFFALIGDLENAIPRFDRLVARDNGRWANRYNDVRYGPEFAALRKDPRVQAILARGAGWLAEMRSSRPTSANPPGAANPVPAPDDKSVAVLAFANLSDDKGNEYFSDGISEELLNVLSKVPGLKVTARTSSFHFKGKDTPIPEIARQLGVAYVIEGSVRKSGDKVRITAQLIKAADGFHVWSDTFTRELKDIFAVQDEIAGLVAKNLSLTLGKVTATAVVAPEAFRLYLEGRQEWSRRTGESLARAEKLFAQAIALEPNFARAHAGLADVWLVRGDQNERSNRDAAKAWVQMSESLDRALRLDPELAEAHASRGNYLAHQEEIAGAEQAYQRALALNPNYASAHQWYGRFLFERGQLEAGLAELELASRLDPLSPIITSNHGMYLATARRWTESLAASERALAIQPGFDQALHTRAWAFSQLDRQPKALAAVRAGIKSFGDNPPPDADGYVDWVKLLAGAGDRPTAERLAAPILAGAGGHSPAEKFDLLIAFGRIDEAFACLERSHLRYKRSYLPNLLDPIYDPVRDDPRFLRKLDEAGMLPAYQQAWAQLLAWKTKSGHR